jgi:hypothetical protein
MNQEAWAEALSDAGLKGKYKDVLIGFWQGFDQGIPQHTIGDKQWFTPINHKSADQARDEIEENLRKEVLAGRMYGPYKHKVVARHWAFFRLSPLGTAVNSDGLVRPINNLSFPHSKGTVDGIPSVNSFVDKKEFETTWENFKVVKRFFRKEKEPFKLGLFEWEKAYRQIPMKKEK